MRGGPFSIRPSLLALIIDKYMLKMANKGANKLGLVYLFVQGTAQVLPQEPLSLVHAWRSIKKNPPYK